MSMGSSQTKKSTQSSTSNETATTTPNTFAPALAPATSFFEGLGDLGAQIKADPYSYTASPNPLQTQGFNAAQGLGGWNGLLGTSSNIAGAVAGAGPNYATGLLYTPPEVKDAVTFGGASSGPAAQATASSYSIADLGKAKGYTAPTLGPAAQATAASLLDGGLDKYLNPATQSIVDTTLADMDIDAGRAKAAQQAAAAKGGAFGGSRYGVAQAALEGELGRARAAAEANLRGSAFDRATALASSDADRRNTMGMFNVGQTNDFTKTQGGLDADALQFGANADNTFSLARFGADNTARQWNAGNATEVSKFNAGETNQNNRTDSTNATSAGIASMNAQNERNALEANLLAQGGMFNVGNFMDLSKFNAGQNDNALDRALSAGGLLSNNAGIMGSNARDDALAMTSVGNSYQDAMNDWLRAPIQNYGDLAGLLSPALIEALSGKTITSNGTSFATGKEKATSSGGLLGSLAGIASIGSAFL